MNIQGGGLGGLRLLEIPVTDDARGICLRSKTSQVLNPVFLHDLGGLHDGLLKVHRDQFFAH